MRNNFLGSGFDKLKAEIIDKGLCTRCGTCVAFCPNKSIEIKSIDSLPELTGNCLNCGKCIDVCPGKNMNMFNFDEGLGRFEQSFIGYSTDEKIRNDASSGGIVTTLLIYALEKGIIDDALVVGINEKAPWEPKAKIVKTKKEIIDAAQSKYTVIPINAALRNAKENKKHGIVGLPCHINGIVKSKAKNFPIKIGIYCGANMPFEATLYLIKRLGIKNLNEIKKLEHRGGEWPGGFLITLKNGEKKFFNKFYHNFIQMFYSYYRCFLCPDFSNELADVSVGDAWLPEYIEKGKGYSMILARNKRGLNLLKKAQKAGKIKLIKISRQKAYSAHKHMIKLKKCGGIGKISIAKRFGSAYPRYKFVNPRSHIFRGFSLILLFIFAKTIKPLVDVTPLRLWGKIAMIFRNIITNQSK